ncbi:hypothetical protein NMY22_g13759 [Coprinellus aureogranulatus]|nr:hypothetical protein NMY22_g13759 [Coprinellus aureogranulatus]
MRFLDHATRALGVAAMSIIDPLLPNFKDFNTSRGINYHYYFSAPSPGQPTLLLVHGFPSLAVDWHPQINYFKEKGFGVVAPDQLGYGGTDKPTEPSAYVHSLLARDMVDILDHENVTDAVAIGHDWGSKTTSVLANLYSERFLAFGFLTVGYVPPMSTGTSIEELRDSAIENLGYENFGYWYYTPCHLPGATLSDDVIFNREFLSSPDGPEVIRDHLRSFFDVWYARDGRVQKFNMGPTGAMRIFLESNSSTPRGSFMSDEQLEFHAQQFGEGSFNGPVNFYKITFNGLTRADDEKIPLDTYAIQKPVFFGGSHNDPICVDWAQVAGAQAYCPNLTVANFNTTHWVTSEATQELNEALDKWVDEVVLA